MRSHKYEFLEQCTQHELCRANQILDTRSEEVVRHDLKPSSIDLAVRSRWLQCPAFDLTFQVQKSSGMSVITERNLTESVGWWLLQILNVVRDRQMRKTHQDSLEDCVAYATLKAEASLNETFKDITTK